MDCQESSPVPQFKSINSSAPSLLYGSTLTSVHDCWKKPCLLKKPLTSRTFVGKVISVLFHMLFGFGIAFVQGASVLLLWQRSSAVILEPQKVKPVTVCLFPPSICHEVMGPDAMILVFWMLNFKPGFSVSSFTFIKRLFSFSSLSAICLQSRDFKNIDR